MARNDDFADAMSATGLAGTLKAPILLTSNTGLSYAAQVALQELSVEKVYIVGGPGAVLPQVENDTNALGVQTERVYGNYSWDTSVKCAEKIHALGGNPNGEVIVAMSTNFQDALSISPLAYRDSIPILLQGNGTTIPRELTADERASSPRRPRNHLGARWPGRGARSNRRGRISRPRNRAHVKLRRIRHLA
ncbi:MAG: cell wall-binding repeat-containing protein [Slackia sp.]